jgi:hypothetical protein
MRFRAPAAAEPPLSAAAGQEPGAGMPGEGHPVPGLPGKGWEIAAELYACLNAVGVSCGKHPAARPDDRCMWCRAEAICRVYRAMTGMAESAPMEAAE